MYISFWDFCKKEVFLLISAIAALISCFFVHITNYVDYIDTDLIAVMFGLMAVVSGLTENNVFYKLSELVVSKSGSSRKLAALLVLTVFFLSMLVTNDVALITFIPFTLMIYANIEQSPIYVIVLQTIAANLGSSLTPLGNPHNLYLFSLSGMSAAEFFKITIPVAAISLVILLILLFFIKDKKITLSYEYNAEIVNKKYIWLYMVLFIMCILSVFNILNSLMVFASVCVVIAIIQPHVFRRVDYSLLATFACFFIFVGNIKNIPDVTQKFNVLIQGDEFAASIGLSQIISNISSAIMISAFSDNYKAIILGTNIGGLGTIIASLASLITYKNYMRTENAHPARFFLIFTALNLLFLILLIAFVLLFMQI